MYPCFVLGIGGVPYILNAVDKLLGEHVVQVLSALTLTLTINLTLTITLTLTLTLTLSCLNP